MVSATTAFGPRPIANHNEVRHTYCYNYEWESHPLTSPCDTLRPCASNGWTRENLGDLLDGSPNSVNSRDVRRNDHGRYNRHQGYAGSEAGGKDNQSFVTIFSVITA